jgi:hypothetical protein
MPDRKSFPAATGTGVDGDDGSIGSSNNSGLACVKGPVSHPCAQVPRDRFDIDFARVGNA